MAGNLVTCIEHINQLVPKPDLVLVTGDITHSGLPEEFEQAVQLLNNLQVPYFVIPGNHDDRVNLMDAFAGPSCPCANFSQESEFINYVIDGFDVRFIALDSTVAGEPGGKICAKRAAWLNQCLSEQCDKATIIFMHHPPVKLGVRETDVDGFKGADMLANVIKKYSNIERILCGHIHLPAFVRWQGTVVSTAPSMGMQLFMDLTMQQPSQFVPVSPAYQLHHWTSDNILVSHTIHVNETHKAYPF